ncbi:MAG: zeta toxin family protein [Verrucomicrobiota bacterium]
MDRGCSFGLESTLSGSSQSRLLDCAKSRGYRVELFFLWIPSVELARERIRRRVALGGHDIPDKDIIRRFARSLKNLVQVYAAMVDSWELLDNRTPTPSLLLSSESATLQELEALLCSP